MMKYAKIAVVLPCLLLMGAGFKYGGIKHDIAVTAKSGAVTVLTASSSQVQSFTGTSAETVDLPSGLTVSNGYWYVVNNEGTAGDISVRDASASVLATVAASQSATFYMKNALVIGGNWSVQKGGGSGGGAVGSAKAYTVSIRGGGSNPTKGTVATDTAWYQCVGNVLHAHWDYRQTAGGTAGSGDYFFSLPSGYTLNTSLQTAGTAANAPQGRVGEFSMLAGTSAAIGFVYISSSNDLGAVYYGDSWAAYAAGSANTPLSTSAVSFTFDAKIPVNECNN